MCATWWPATAARVPVRAGPARSGYFAAPTRATLTFRVDLRQAEWPPLPPGAVLSHIWAVLVRDVDAARAALQALRSLAEYEAEGVLRHGDPVIINATGRQYTV